MHRRRLLVLALLAPGAARLPAADVAALTEAQKRRASDLLVKLRALADLPEVLEPVLKEEVEGIELPVREALSRAIDAEVPKAAAAYRSAFRTAATASTNRFKTKATIQEVKTHREAVLSLSPLGDRLTKDAIVAKGDPALKRLIELHRINRADLLKANPVLTAERARLAGLVTLRGRVRGLAALDAPAKEFVFDDLEREEKELADRAPPYDRNALAVMERNKVLAKEVQPGEAEGIQELNEWRAMLGLAAVVIDPKLCEAARDHSKDMKEKGFFAHESPVSGKKTPWDRARNFGTSANAENIYMGSGKPADANMGWFHSPGHHINMLRAGHKRIGLGKFDGHWTQMFGA